MMLLTAAVLLLTASCSKDDDEPQQVNPPAAAGARLQVMMVFAPGQLGDGGYADGLLQGASALELPEAMESWTDTIDVHFISLYSVADTRQALKNWAATAAHPFYESTYERRLLVLTEPYMTAWLSEVKGYLRETDEVLIMKADEAYTQRIADTYGLGNRAHGANFDMTEAIGLYCDGIEDIIRQQLGNDVNLTVYALSDYVDAEDLNEETNVAYIQAAYTAAAKLDQHFRQTGYGFVIADLGTCNSGMLNYMLGTPLYHYEVLMLDNSIYTYNYMAICRNGFAVILQWLKDWMDHSAGTMPRFKLFKEEVVHNLGEVVSEK